MNKLPELSNKELIELVKNDMRTKMHDIRNQLCSVVQILRHQQVLMNKMYQ